MTLLIQDEHIEGLLSMKDCIEAMEEAYKEYGLGVAVNRPRLRYRCTTPVKDMDYWTNIHAGAIIKYGVACIRIDSVTQERRFYESKKETKRLEFRHPTKRNWGFILLFSLETGELLAIVHDFTLSGVRVGATNAVAVKYLARDGAETLGMVGTGKIARRNVEAISAVRPIRKVKVYSPSEEHRRVLCEEIGKSLKLEVTQERNVRSVVEGSDIVSCCTNSNEPVFSGEWLTQGQLVTSIVNSDVVMKRTEVDETTFAKSDVIVINDKESVVANKQTELLEPIEKGLFDWNKVHELGKIVAGQAQGRTSDEEIIYYKNNTGQAIQFAAACAIIYKEARKRQIGEELPTSWFGTDLTSWHKLGFFPSP